MVLRQPHMFVRIYVHMYMCKYVKAEKEEQGTESRVAKRTTPESQACQNVRKEKHKSLGKFHNSWVHKRVVFQKGGLSEIQNKNSMIMLFFFPDLMPKSQT